MNAILHRPGFLGTSANWGADFTLVAMLVIALIFTTGALLAVRRHYRVHRWVQTTGVILNVIFVLWLMLLPYRDFVLPGIPQQLDERFYLVTTLHALVGLPTFLFGIFVALRGNGLMIKPLRFNNYKRYMRTAYTLYMITTLLGVWVYFVWFVNNPSPPIYE